MEAREIAGFLFVGDPHLSGNIPGRRKDKDYTARILGKLAQAVDIANERDLLVVFLGDLFERPVEDDEWMRARLHEELRRCRHRPVTNVGNHDPAGSRLREGDSLYTVWSTGLLDVAATSGGFETFSVGGVKVGLGFTPHGQEIPRDVRHVLPDADALIWVTHHDIAFENSYPGAQQPHEILGCGLVVNGHMHLRKKPVTCGKTKWINPGNITRQAIDAKDHIPAVWEFKPENAKFERHVLDHAKDVFDLTGHQVAASKSPGEKPSTPEERESGKRVEFVEALKAELGTDMEETDDGEVLWEEISGQFEAETPSQGARRQITALFQATGGRATGAPQGSAATVGSEDA